MRCAEAVALECNVIFECCQVLSRCFDFWFASCAVRHGARASRTHRLLQGRFFGKPCVPSLVLCFRTTCLPLLPLWEKGVAFRGRFFGKPLHSFSHSGLPEAQTPPSPRVGEGGRGDEGAHAHRNARASLPGTLPLMRCARLRRARGRDARAPSANLRCARPCRGRFVGKPLRAISRFSHQDAQTPPSPRVGMENAPQG